LNGGALKKIEGGGGSVFKKNAPLLQKKVEKSTQGSRRAAPRPQEKRGANRRIAPSAGEGGRSGRKTAFLQRKTGREEEAWSTGVELLGTPKKKKKKKKRRTKSAKNRPSGLEKKAHPGNCATDDGKKAGVERKRERARKPKASLR